MDAELNFEHFPTFPEWIRVQARKWFEAGKPELFLSEASNDHGMGIVRNNRKALLEHGMYERALIRAYAMCRVNHSQLKLQDIEWLFRLGDRQKFLDAGDPPPSSGPFKVYRGVAGPKRIRRVCGFSWTLNLEIACYFANRSAKHLGHHLGQPGVYTVTMNSSDVYCFVNRRAEQELIGRPKGRCRKLPLSAEEIERRALKWIEENRQPNQS
jgi:hypothetical protein